MNQDHWNEINEIFKKAGDNIERLAKEKRKREEDTLMYSDLIKD